MAAGSMSRPSPVSLRNSLSCCRATSIFRTTQRLTMTIEHAARPTTPHCCEHDDLLRRYRDAQDSSGGGPVNRADRRRSDPHGHSGEIGAGGMAATVLVVDDEPDLEKLITRKFR